MKIGQKIIILGCAGSGKSTLARELGARLNIPVTHLDTHYFLPNWVVKDKTEFAKFIEEKVKEDSFIIDGNYRASLDIRLGKADTVVLIDFNRLFCLYRVIKRRFKYHKKSRPDVAEGCNEKIDREFLNWIWNYKKRNLPKILDKVNAACKNGGIEFFHLTTKKEVRQFVLNIEN